MLVAAQSLEMTGDINSQILTTEQGHQGYMCTELFYHISEIIKYQKMLMNLTKVILSEDV